jgi:predicted enzyme related to lactoylglutathione lyase
MAVRTLKRGTGAGTRKKAAARPASAPKAKSGAKRPSARGSNAGGGKNVKVRAAARQSTNGAAEAGATPVANAYPSAIGLTQQHMDYTTHDIEGVRRFYTEVLGLSRFRFIPENNYLAIDTGPSSSLGFMPPMPGPPERWRPPREPNLYLWVEDVDRAFRELSARGVTFEQEPADMPWGHRIARLRDPEGRMLCLAQQLRRPKGA